jgi:hypothetical protein
MSDRTPPYLTLVDPTKHEHDHDAEFIPLPYYPWDERPPGVPLDSEEVATAIHLSDGSLPGCARLLKVPVVRVLRSLRASPRLQRIREEALQVALSKAEGHVIESIDAITPTGDPHIARREWAATKLLQSRLAMGTTLSPGPAASVQSNASLTVNPSSRTLTFRWRTAADAAPAEELDGPINND